MFYLALSAGEQELKERIAYGWIAMPLDFFFVIWRLFPPQYLCVTIACARTTHNSVMTIVQSLFDSARLASKYRLTKTVISLTMRIATSIQGLLRLCWVIYSAATEQAPGDGTKALIVIACLIDAISHIFRQI